MDKESCKHEKVYANYILASYPPQRPWVCRKCGKKGCDIGTADFNNEYEELIKKFGDEEKQIKV